MLELRAYLTRRRNQFHNRLIALFLLCMAIQLILSGKMQVGFGIAMTNLQSIFLERPGLCPRQALLNRFVQHTTKGPMTYREILQLVYEPFGYEYVDIYRAKCNPNLLLFPLKYVNFDCSTAFSDWSDVQIKANFSFDTKNPLSPPQVIPEHLKDKYLLNGYAQLRARYINEIPANLPKTLLEPWTEAVIDKYIGMYNHSNWNLLPYGAECAAVFYALKQFKPTGQIGMVIGSQTPWVETMALFHGATKLITVEYAPLTITVPTIEYLHPEKLVRNWQQYMNMDFVISFSSIEHSGLARYGDPPDPIGDFRELRKILCLLKEDGLLYLGLPSGPDLVEYNAHRVYGYIRWPMIAANFEFVGAFYSTNPMAYEAPPVILSSDYHKQFVFVLRKKIQTRRWLA